MSQMKLITTFFYILFFLVLPGKLCAQIPANHCAESAHLFVQRFYDWYVPLAKGEAKEPASSVAIRERGIFFSKGLLALLKEDAAAEAKADGYVVGLDFDPFLNTQDPSDRYDIGGISPNGDSCLVSIFGTRYGERSTQPDVVADISYRNARWVFVDFQYPDKGVDLLQILGALHHNWSNVKNKRGAGDHTSAPPK